MKNNNFFGWNGFMGNLTSGIQEYSQSAINYLPFVNSAPNDYNTLYTALQESVEEARNKGMKTCIITCDQPLYIKKRDMVAALPNYDILVFIRLGGFHACLLYTSRCV